MSSLPARLGATTMALAAALLVGGTAVAQESTSTSPTPEPPNQWTELEHKVEFDKSSYRTGDKVVITLTITNVSGLDTMVTGRHVFPHEPGDIYLDHGTWGQLDSFDGDGVPLASGETYTHELHGVIADPNMNEAAFHADLVASEEQFGRLFPIRETVPVEIVHGSVTGTAYLDRNGNRAIDDGEPVGGVEVIVSSVPGEHSDTVVTDKDGRFIVTGLAPVPHYVNALPLDDWSFQHSVVDVVADATTDVAVPGVRPFKESLTAELRFTRDEYQPGDVAEIDVTLTNTGTVRIAGIHALCDRFGSASHIVDIEWGELTYGGPGLALAPSESRTFRVRGTVPEPTRKSGFAVVACDFGFDGTDNPQAIDYARVAGTTGSTKAVAYHDRDNDLSADPDERIAGIDIRLIDVATGRVSVTARTGKDGVAAFDDIPTGRYRADVSGPWDIAANTYLISVYSDGCGQTCEWPVRVVPGKDDLPATTPQATEPLTTTSSAPAAQGSPPPANLADTGADVRWLFGFGVLAVLAGAALMFVRRRAA